MFKKIKQLLLAEFQEIGEYPGDMLIYTFAPFVLPLVLMSVWVAITKSSNTIGTERSYIISYFYYQIIVNRVVGTWHSYFLGEKIRNGEISKDLLKPISRVWYDIINNVAEKIWKITFSIPALIILGFILHKSLILPTGNIFVFIITVLGASIITFLIAHIIGISAFWFSDTGVITSYNEVLNFIASGRLFPLSYVGSFIPLGVLNFLPYKYTLAFPIDVLLGKISGQELLTGILVQIAWIAFLFLLCRAIWIKGLRKYGGYGG